MNYTKLQHAPRRSLKTSYNPDYVFTSKGRLTDKGYIVEIEIPFKSLRYKKIARQLK